MVNGVRLHDLHDQPHRRTTSGSETAGTATKAHFGELRAPLLEFIEGSEIIVGCVAWLTDQQILAALSRRPAAVVVQKENWWKKADNRGRALAARYVGLKGGVRTSQLGYDTDIELAPIACAGTAGSGPFANPLMHHKFLVRCTLVNGMLVADAVWTGSFNLSNNANDSCENAVEIYDPEIAEAYLREFSLVMTLSEPMNWTTRAPKPGRLGKVFIPPASHAAPKPVRARRPRRAAKKRATVTPIKAAPSKRAPAKKAPVKKTAARRPPARAAAAKRPAKKAS